MEQATDYIIEELKMTKAELKKYKDQELEDKRIKTLYTLSIGLNLPTDYEYLEKLKRIQEILKTSITDSGVYMNMLELLNDLTEVGFDIYTMPYLQTIFFVDTLYALAIQGNTLQTVVVDDKYISKELFHILVYVDNFITKYIDEHTVR